MKKDYVEGMKFRLRGSLLKKRFADLARYHEKRLKEEEKKLKKALDDLADISKEINQPHTSHLSYSASYIQEARSKAEQLQSECRQRAQKVARQKFLSTVVPAKDTYEVSLLDIDANLEPTRDL
jgi:ElaB/YqjD/DUF883 family membrane-anchored ribosome-binding protein